VAESKKWWQSRTVWVNLISLLLVIVAELSKAEYGLPAQVLQIIAILGPILNIILRSLTNQPISWGSGKAQD
jgi:hypothetical protein